MKVVLGYYWLPVCSRSSRISINSVPHLLHHEFYPPDLFPLPFCRFQSLLSEALPGGNPLSFDEFKSILPRRVRYSSSIPSTVVNSSPKIYKSIIGSISLSKNLHSFLSFSLLISIMRNFILYNIIFSLHPSPLYPLLPTP